MKIALFVAPLLFIAPTLAAAEDTPPSAVGGQTQLGQVEFPVSCTPAAQQQFNRAVAILHSFWYEEAIKAFGVVTETDPDCAMGDWGVAMSYWTPLWSPPTEATLKAGSAAVRKAQAIGTKTDRERDYIEAIATFYRDYDKLDHRTRSVAYRQVMEQLSVRYPDDREAAIFYALALDATALPSDKTYTNQKTAAAWTDLCAQQFGEGVAWAESLHAMDYLAYAHLQLAQDHEAKKVLDQMLAFRKVAPETPAAAYALAAVPARYAVERRDWTQAAALSRPPLAFPWDKFPWTSAMITFS
jgi:hypothetical protein